MVDVVGAYLALAQLDEVVDDSHEIVHRERELVHRGVYIEALVELVATDLAEAVPLRVEEHRAEIAPGMVEGRGFRAPERLVDPEGGVVLVLLHAGAEASLLLGERPADAVEIGLLSADVEECGPLDALVEQELELLDRLDGLVAADEYLARGRVDDVLGEGLEREVDGSAALAEGGLEVVLDPRVEPGEDLGVGDETEGPQEHGYRYALGALVDVGEDDIVGVEHQIEPGAALGDDARAADPPAALNRLLLEEYAGAPVELADDNPLGPVDDEGACVGHQRQLAEEDRLLHYPRDLLVIGRAAEDQPQLRVERSGIGQVLSQGLLDAISRRARLVADVLEGEFPVCALYRECVEKYLVKTLWEALIRWDFCLKKHLERLLLDLEKIRHIYCGLNPRVVPHRFLRLHLATPHAWLRTLFVPEPAAGQKAREGIRPSPAVRPRPGEITTAA